MNAPKKLSQKLNDYMARKDDLRVKEWMFNFNEGLITGLGLDNNEIGGPYATPKTQGVYSGLAYVRWADGRISYGKINAQALEDLDGALKEWKLVSYADPDAPEILEPLPMPTGLKIKDDKIVDLITKDSSYLFEILNFYNKELRKMDYTKTINGKVNAKHIHTTLLNSKGLNLGFEGTKMQTYAYVNDAAFDSYSKRKMLQKKDLKAIIKEIDTYMTHSKNELQIKSGKIPIILTPSILDSFLEKYLISSGENLQGDAVANNQSLYNQEDFKTKKQVFHEKINLIIDGLKDYSTNTEPCSEEGVPATKQHIIANGRLITPLLDLKYAKKLGMAPTSPGTIDLEIEQQIPYTKIIKGIDYGLVVYGVLGMHTQDSKEGRYTLTVNQGLLVENGKVKGTIKDAIITGNFFNALKDEKTKFAKYRQDELAMKTEASITAKS